MTARPLLVWVIASIEADVPTAAPLALVARFGVVQVIPHRIGSVEFTGFRCALAAALVAALPILTAATDGAAGFSFVPFVKLIIVSIDIKVHTPSISPMVLGFVNYFGYDHL